MSTRFDAFLHEQLKDPEFKKEFDALRPEHAIVQKLLDARNTVGSTQKEFSDHTGTARGDISQLG